MDAPKTERASRFRNALLAGAVTLGFVGAAGTGAFLGQTGEAFAEAVKVEAQTPADFSAVVETVKPAVVSVRTKSEMRPVGFDGRDGRGRGMPEGFEEFFRRFGSPDGTPQDRFFGERGEGRPGMRSGPRFSMGQGSGFFISEDGYVVTNNHVVDGAKEVLVVMDDGRELTAKVIGTDARTDLALLKVDGTGFTYVNLAETQPKVGQWVLAVGNPFGLGGSVTAGIVSASGRDIGSGPYDDFMQIDAPVNRGNSGGPTFDVKGEVVGVNTAIFSPSGGNVGVAFAIPSTVVREVIAELRDDGTVTRGWLGVQIQPVTRDIADSLGLEGTKGALVNEPQADSPAAAAGIKAGDVILDVDGKEVLGPRELARLIAAYEPDEKVAIKVVRDGSEQTIEVTLGKLGDQVAATGRGTAPAAPAAPDSAAPAGSDTLSGLGLTVAPNDRGDGLVVTEVGQGSAAEEKGIAAGDVITQVGGEAVKTAEDLEAGIKNAGSKGRKAVLVQVERDGSNRFVALPLDRG